VRQDSAKNSKSTEDIGVELIENLLGAIFQCQSNSSKSNRKQLPALLNSALKDVSSIVNQHVDASIDINSLGDYTLQDLVGGSDVEGHGGCAARCKLGKFLGVSSGGNDFVTTSESGEGHLAAETGGAGGDEPDFGGGGDGHCHVVDLDAFDLL
jgi:hypothetical protein